MVLICFVVDTSASMNQKTIQGMTLLDSAKAAIEHFVKIRSRDPTSRADRYFLVTCEESMGAIKVGWKDSFPYFVQEVKNLVARDLGLIGLALKRGFDLLNVHRLQSGIENYGLGRLTAVFEPSILVLLTDGGSLTSTAGVSESLSLPMNQTISGNELTLEPFRWDQRLFSVVLQFSQTGTLQPVASKAETLYKPMSEVTGGNLQIATNIKSLLGSIDNITARLQPGVVLSTEVVSTNPQFPLGISRKMILVKNNFCFWPIPEPFFPDQSMSGLPPRTAQPLIKILPQDSDPFIIEGFPFDKHEMEPSALTQFLLGHKQGVCWYCYVSGSSKIPNQLGEPFGYLKASRSTNSVSLFVLPYAFPKLWPLLDELISVYNKNPIPKWKQEFDKYLQIIPTYYFSPLRSALKRMQLPFTVVPEIEVFSLQLQNTMRRIRGQNKVDLDKFINSRPPKEILQSAPIPLMIPPQQKPVQQQTPQPQSQSQTQQQQKGINRLLSSNPFQNNGSPSSPSSPSQQSTNANEPIDRTSSVSKLTLSSQQTPTQQQQTQTQSSSLPKNVFEINRNRLLDQIASLRHSVRHNNFDDTLAKHSVPISVMSNFEEMLMKSDQLRPVKEETTQPILFGNPFRKASQISGQRIVDEAEDEGAKSFGGSIKRKAQGGGPAAKKRRFESAGGGDTSMSGISANASPTSSPDRTPPSSPRPGPPKPQPISAQQHNMPPQQQLQPTQQVQAPSSPSQRPPWFIFNLNLKNELLKIIRKPGKESDPMVLTRVKETQGDLGAKKNMMDELIKEAKNQKKVQLVAQLEQMERQLQ